jgi:hypothetical protein
MPGVTLPTRCPIAPCPCLAQFHHFRNFPHSHVPLVLFQAGGAGGPLYDAGNDGDGNEASGGLYDNTGAATAPDSDAESTQGDRRGGGLYDTGDDEGTRGSALYDIGTAEPAAASSPLLGGVVKAGRFDSDDIGRRVSVAGRGAGVLRYVGPAAAWPGMACGVELDGKGDHDGRIKVLFSIQFDVPPSSTPSHSSSTPPHLPSSGLQPPPPPLASS